MKTEIEERQLYRRNMPYWICWWIELGPVLGWLSPPLPTTSIGHNRLTTTVPTRRVCYPLFCSRSNRQQRLRRLHRQRGFGDRGLFGGGGGAEDSLGWSSATIYSAALLQLWPIEGAAAVRGDHSAPAKSNAPAPALSRIISIVI
jgi:hypothetical protein